MTISEERFCAYDTDGYLMTEFMDSTKIEVEDRLEEAGYNVDQLTHIKIIRVVITYEAKVGKGEKQ